MPEGSAGKSDDLAGAESSVTLFPSVLFPEIYASDRLVIKNPAASAAVVRVRNDAAPRLPNTVCEAPLPNAAPMSAPLPCWISTSTTKAIAINTCITRIIVTISLYTAKLINHDRSIFQPAARQIARNSDACRDAPPIKPPSISGILNNSAAFEALTLPP